MQAIDLQLKFASAIIADVNSKVDKRQLVLEWLSPGPFDERLKSLQAARTRETGSWFLESNPFQEWIAGSGPNILLCIGRRN